jgi:hypothetical protein
MFEKIRKKQVGLACLPLECCTIVELLLKTHQNNSNHFTKLAKELKKHPLITEKHTDILFL